MILGFTRQLNRKPTYFPEKILLGLRQQNLLDDYWYGWFTTDKTVSNKDYSFIVEFEKTIILKPKYHSFREDKKDRWKAGMMIDFFINVRTKKMFRFCSVRPVVSTQKVEIFYKGLFVAVAIDKQLFYTNADLKLGKGAAGMLELAQNDGFDNVQDFFAYFNEDFTGKIIHWTDLKY